MWIVIVNDSTDSRKNDQGPDKGFYLCMECSVA